MLARLVLLFTVLPLIELVILIEIGTIGAFSTVLVVIATAIIGASLARFRALTP